MTRTTPDSSLTRSPEPAPLAARQILAIGGGGFSMEPENPRLDDFALSLTRKAKPRVCFLGTASGDSASYIDRFYASFPPERAVATHLPLFERLRGDLRARLLANDLVYVGGGSAANLLALWRLHGVDRLVREAWERGAVLVGVDGGACCLFEGCVTDAFGPILAPLGDGLGYLPGTFCTRYDTDPRCRPRYRQLVGEGFPAGLAADDGVALHFMGRELKEAVSSRPNAAAWRVLRDTKVREERLEARLLR